MHVFLILTEGDQKSKENEAEKKEKTEKPDPDAEAEDQIHGPGKEIFWNPICKAILDPRWYGNLLSCFKNSDTTTDALVLCFPFNSGQET